MTRRIGDNETSMRGNSSLLPRRLSSLPTNANLTNFFNEFDRTIFRQRLGQGLSVVALLMSLAGNPETKRTCSLLSSPISSYFSPSTVALYTQLYELMCLGLVTGIPVPFEITPLLGGLIGVVTALLFVTVATLVAMKIRNERRAQRPSDLPLKKSAVPSSEDLYDTDDRNPDVVPINKGINRPKKKNCH